MSQPPQELSPLKRAYLALEKAQTRLEAAERYRREAIAVVGMACRFPGGVNSPDDYWKLLAEGRDAVVEVPASRWDVDALFDPNPDAPGKVCSRYGGFIDNVDRFDAAFFGIAPREAESLDPQQRLLLEVAHEAMESGAVAPETLHDSAAGVYVGLASGDYYCLLTGHCRERIDAYMGTGTSPNSAAGRVSYVFGLRGPCVAIDTACSSSLVALHLACQGLRHGECDTALAGGVNLMLMPDLSITFSKAHMLCPDGRCKTFDADANGYVRGEGVGILLLKRLSDARAAGDRILAVIRGSAMNHAGASGGLTVPNGPAQQDVIRRALEQAQRRPEEVDYIEAHGTGTALGDPIEVGALAGVFAGRSRPLWIGSVKTNLGHLEAASGVAGVIKVVLSLQHGEIPPHLHFRTPSPRIPWESLPVKVLTRRQPWPAGERRRVAGVSSFGFSGINAHVVIEEAPVPSPVAGEGGRKAAPAATSLPAPLTPGPSPASGRGEKDLPSPVAGEGGERSEPGEGGRKAMAAATSQTAPLTPGPSPASGRGEEYPFTPGPSPETGEGRKTYLLPLSAKHPDALRQLAERYARHLAEDRNLQLADVAFTAAVGRGHHEHRLALVACTIDEACDLLQRFVQGEPCPAVHVGHATAPSRTAGPLPSGETDRRAILEGLARAYVAGAALDWQAIAATTGGRKISLPTYPYQRRRYWVHDGPATAADEAPVAAGTAHPLLGRRILLAAAEGHTFESRLSTRRPALLDQHRLATAAIMPAAGFFEIPLAAARELSPERPPCVEQMVLEQAMPLAERPPRIMQLAVQPDENGYRFELFSRPDQPAGEEASWTRHAQGRLVADGEPEPASSDLDRVKRRCSAEVPLESFYRRLEERGLRYGPAFQGLRRLWRGEGEALGRVELAGEAAGEMEGYLLYPPLLDACLHVTAELLDPRVAGSGGAAATYVPVGVQRLRFVRSPGPVVWSHARLRDEGAAPGASRYAIDVDLLDPAGLVARLEGLQVQQVDLDALAREFARRQEAAADPAGTAGTLADEIARLPAGQQRERVAQFLEGQAVKILKLARDERPSHHRSLFELGLDSLMSVELLYRINETLRLNLPMQILLDNSAIGSLAGAIVQELVQLESRLQPAKTGTPAGLPAEAGTPTAARLRLIYCESPEANIASMADWQQALGPEIDVCPIPWPGGSDGPSLERAAEAALDLLDRPFAVFGRQSGTRLALELARTIHGRFGLSPVQVILADAPMLPDGLKTFEFPVTVLASSGGSPDALLELVRTNLQLSEGQ